MDVFFYLFYESLQKKKKRREDAQKASAFCIWGAIIFGICVSLILLVFKQQIFGLKQGAAGAAIATVLGNIIADIYYIYAMRKKAKRLSTSFKNSRITTQMAGGIFAIGIPASITNLMQSFMVMMTNHFLLAYGNDKIAAMGIALKVNMITALILVGVAFGGQPLIGYNFGSKNQKRLKEILRFAYLLEIGLALVFTVIMCVCAPEIISVFMKDSQIITNGVLMLRCQQMSMVFMAVTLVSRNRRK